MKTQAAVWQQWRWGASGVHLVWVGAVVTVLAGGCSSERPGSLSGVSLDRSRLLQADRLGPGPVQLVLAPEPAAFGFDRPQGRVESAGEGATRAARTVLNTPDLHHGQLESAVGVVEFAAAPFAAGYGALRAAHQKLPPDRLAEMEARLSEAMSQMAGPDQFQRALAESVGKESGRPVELGPSPGGSGCEAASAVLQARVEELRLQRTGPKDSSFALHIKAWAKLLRGSDGAVLFDQPYEYQSGKAMFIDWARTGGLAGVAQTGYQELAEQMAKSAGAHLAPQPVLLGEGYGNSPPRRAQPHPAYFARAAALGPEGLQLVSYGAADTPSVEIFSSGSSFAVQKPLTKGEAVSEAQEHLEYQFDGLEQDRNSVVQFVACVVAVPIGLYEQAAGAVQGVWPWKVKAADARLMNALQQAQPGPSLAGGVGRELAMRTAAPVRLAKAQPGVHSEGPAGLVLCAAHELQPVSFPGALPEPGTALEIHVVRAGLLGEPGVNSRLALQVEAEATLKRVDDGEVLYSCPLKYRSVERKFGQWGARDAQPFREELDRCYGQMSGAVADQLIAEGLIVPARAGSAVARN